METVTKKYTFSRIFGPNSTQQEIFNLIIKPKIHQFINGKNATFTSYGASGSGKTFTLIGTAAEPGIIPRSLEYMFKTLPKMEETPLIMPTESGNVEMLNQISREAKLKVRNDLLKSSFTTIGKQHITTYKEMKSRLTDHLGGLLENNQGVILNVWISFAEIYNENIYDLLIPEGKCRTDRKKLRLGSVNENTYIKDLTLVSISSAIQAYQILRYGLDNVAYASTLVNANSSRSHCIFTIKLVQMLEERSAYRCHYFNFCDLAGSERLKKTLNVDARLKESNNINTSLLVLGRCIYCIRESLKRKVKNPIPYRDSKLTRLFQKGLSGQEAFNMIVNINASNAMYEESQQVLNFSAIAKNILVNYTNYTSLTLKKEKEFCEYPQARSTSYDEEVQKKSRKSDIIELETIMIDMYDQLATMQQNVVSEEDRVREEMTNSYAIIIDKLKQRHQKELTSARNRHQKELQTMNASYLQHDEEVIIISSSDEEEKGEGKDTFISDCLMLQNELASKNEKINELKKSLADIEISYLKQKEECEVKLQNLSNQNMDLKDEEYLLETAINY